MTDDALKKMNRQDLLELLIASEKENAQLREQLQQQEEQLQNRDLQVKDAGTMAEAAMSLNSLFEKADKAAAQYLENIKRCSEEQESTYNKIISEAQQKANKIIAEAEKVSAQKRKEADDYWNNISARLEAFYKDHVGLREELSAQYGRESDEDL